MSADQLAIRAQLRGDDTRVRTLPKAHLHLHLKHCVRPRTLHELAAREGISLNGLHHFTNLAEFLARGGILRACIVRPDDIQRICWELVEDEARNGVLYLEPMVVLHRWVPRFGTLEDVFWLFRDALDRAQAAFGVEVGLMIGFSRHRDSVAKAEELARFAATHADHGVVAFGFGGNEALAGPEPFVRACAIAREAGLLVVPHAGETAGPLAVATTLDLLHPDRIAHGIRAVEDRRVLAQLAGEQVTCDVCPTSNLRLGVVSKIEEHPIGRLLTAGVPVTLGADDTLEFDSTVADEYTLVRDVFGLSDKQLARIAKASALASGASAATKGRIIEGIQHWLAM